MAHALGVSRSELLLRHMQDAAPEGFAALVERRARHEPVAYIIGRKEFYGRELVVTPGRADPARGQRDDCRRRARAAFPATAPRARSAASARARCC